MELQQHGNCDGCREYEVGEIERNEGGCMGPWLTQQLCKDRQESRGSGNPV